jgi:uncharacterized protein YkwD
MKLRLPIASVLAALACAAAPGLAPAVAATETATAAAAAAPTQQLIAPASACPNQTGPGAPAGQQLRAMRCLTDFARQGRGLPPLADSAVLDRAAGRKSAEILRCDSFSHEACGHSFTYWMEQFGYDGCSEGENIAWGNGRLGSVREIFRAWMHSAGHRENILGPYEEIGIGLRVGRLEGNAGAHVWTQDFGSPC